VDEAPEEGTVNERGMSDYEGLAEWAAQASEADLRAVLAVFYVVSPTACLNAVKIVSIREAR